MALLFHSARWVSLLLCVWLLAFGLLARVLVFLCGWAWVNWLATSLIRMPRYHNCHPAVVLRRADRLWGSWLYPRR